MRGGRPRFAGGGEGDVGDREAQLRMACGAYRPSCGCRRVADGMRWRFGALRGRRCIADACPFRAIFARFFPAETDVLDEELEILSEAASVSGRMSPYVSRKSSVRRMKRPAASPHAASPGPATQEYVVRSSRRRLFACLGH